MSSSERGNSLLGVLSFAASPECGENMGLAPPLPLGGLIP